MFLTFIRSEFSFIMFKIFDLYLLTKMFYKTTLSFVDWYFLIKFTNTAVFYLLKIMHTTTALTITTSESSKEKSKLFKRFERFSDFNKYEE